MTEKHIQLKKLIWQVPAYILLLIAMGNLIMLIVLRGEAFTFRMFLYSSINSVLVGGTFMMALTAMVVTLDRKLPWLHFPLKRLIVQTLVTIVLSLTIIIVAILLNGLFTHEQITTGYFLDHGFFMVKIAFSFIVVGSLISNAIMFFKNWKEAAVQQEKLKREQLALQYETLKSQVNPHFLFNNLNSLTSLISSNPDKAIEFVKKLSEVYRYVLDQKDQELVALDTELKFLESYIFLQKIRFGTNLDVQINVSAKNFKVIPLSVQMLVENAIKHNEIKQDDIERVVDAARAVPIPMDQEVIHVLPQEFMVDGQADIQDPLGMAGVRLEADVHIVTGSATAVHNIIKCCNRAGLQVTDVVLEPLASACAVLTREEMELGVGLLDIGGGTADLAIFADGTIKHTFVLGLGGQNLTNDLAIGLRTPQKEAERLKEEFGSALASLIDKDQIIEVPSVGGRKNRRLTRRVMGEILEPRVEEMFTLINQELLDSRYKELVTAGLVLTGGSCLLDNMEELAEQIFDLPVRTGRPENIGGMVEVIGTPQWATGVGLVIYGMKNGPGERFKRPKGGVIGRFTGRIKDWFKGII